ncbi:CsgG/HfaB family protein [uncultured Treponema sp.]|uniref:CsgG/HfaB family protein n=1 Tax=uncultured Treponema sp. TaxID=162155 RepID=UPI0025CED889|nr:CsgG/HfaB family protein [uncultured Treponema sp.]
MKKLITTILTTILLSFATFAQTANSIAVPAPKTVNLGDGNNWIPLFIQGVITSNFQQYSGMKVVDRQNVDMVKAEQKLSESSAYDEKNAIELGKLTSAKFIVTGSITVKSSSYALMFSITDAETGETKASATVPNCLPSALEDGSAANQISYDLMKGFGISLSSEAQKKLTQKASVMSSDISAQASVAKGIVAEQSGSNIEALTYYIQARKNDKKLSEATSRMANMTTVVASGNFGANAKNLIKLRNDWDKLLREAAELIAANPPEFELKYFTDIKALELTPQDYENGTMSFSVTTPVLSQVNGSENEKIAGELLTTLHGIEQSKNWGDKINGFPWSYGSDIGDDNWLEKAVKTRKIKGSSFYTLEDKGYEENVFVLTLLDSKKKEIATKKISFYIIYCTGTYRYGYALDFKTPGIMSDNSYGGVNSHSYSGEKATLIFDSVPVNDADTDKLYITVTQEEGRPVSILSDEVSRKTKVEKDVKSSDSMLVDEVIPILKSGKHNGKIKIAGSLDQHIMDRIIWACHDGRKNIVLDLSEMNLDSFVFDFKLRERYGVIKELILPYSTEKLILNFSVESITIPAGLKNILYSGRVKTINYMGTESQWKNILVKSKITEPIKAKIICNYDPERTKAETVARQKVLEEYKRNGGIEASKAADFIASITAEDNLHEITVLGTMTYPELLKIADAAALNKSIDSCHLGAVTNFIIPEGIDKLGDEFSFIFKSLKSVTIPASLTSIGNEVFKVCDSLETVNYRGTKKQWKSIKIGKDNKPLTKAKINYEYKGE